MNQLKVEGFYVSHWGQQWPEAFKELAQWIQEVGLFLVFRLIELNFVFRAN